MALFIKYKHFFSWVARAILVGILISVDQLSKVWSVKFIGKVCENAIGYCVYEVLPVLDVANICNSGISFGMLNSIPMGSFFLSLIGVIATGIFIYLLQKSNNLLEKIAFTLIIAGAIGNLIDRIRHSCVIDFIQIHYLEHYFPVFNIADCFVSIGGFLLILYEILKYLKQKNEPKNSGNSI